MVLVGRSVQPGEILPELLQDRDFYEISSGGITISGGEPLLQAEFCIELAAACKAEGLHVALDTSGYAPWDQLRAALRHCDLVLYDIKSLLPDRHRRLTGVDNALILDNLYRAVEFLGPERVLLRYPLIAGHNSGSEELERLKQLCVELDVSVEILPYHRLGEGKYEALGMARPAGLPDPQAAMQLARQWQDELNRAAISCAVA